MLRSMYALAFTAAAAATACGGGNGGGTGTQPPVFSAVTVSPPTASIAVAGTQQLTATPRDQSGNAMSGLPAATFSSDAQNRATVSTGGLVTGVSAGTANISASITQGGTTRTGQSVITVTGGAASTATVQATTANTFSPASVTIAQAGTVTWEWAGVEHNVVFNDVTGRPNDIAARSTGSESRTFASLGTFPYQCTIHPGMNGQVAVVAP